MQTKPRTYTSETIDVIFDTKRCIHAQECVNGLPAVFDIDQRPWIQPQNGTPDEIAAVVRRCPSGALHVQRKDGGPAETPDPHATIRIVPDGPLYVRGKITLLSSSGDVLLEDTRMAICRCGVSNNKPLCDNSHIQAMFQDEGMPNVQNVEGTPTQALKITPSANGPLHLEGVDGDFTILNAEGQPIFVGNDAWLCRCGQSSNKPFCDSTHRKVNFVAE
ncbi:MAG: hypothetical protein CUN56_00400 [Phototrophicales bacterium]|nr:MAG: hypothetical protein CUN56_00400 [Phototrophicales bacterium]